MADDIVIRLREFHCCDNTDCRQAELAADEIERLRKQLALTEKWRDNYKAAYERARGAKTHSEQLRESIKKFDNER